jgi:type IV fimbrial biogenesis protein FimT
MPTPLTCRAFTLTELLSSLAITAALLGFVYPSAVQFIRNQQIANASNLVMAALTLARSESIKRRLPVLVDNADGHWESGWRVFADTNNNGLHDQFEPLLLQTEALPEGVVAKGNTPVMRYIRYTPTGTSNLLSGAFQAGTLTLCHATGTQPVRRLVLSSSGRIRRSKTASGPC